jgi:hypothetical protein
MKHRPQTDDLPAPAIEWKKLRRQECVVYTNPRGETARRLTHSKAEAGQFFEDCVENLRGILAGEMD